MDANIIGALGANSTVCLLTFTGFSWKFNFDEYDFFPNEQIGTDFFGGKYIGVRLLPQIPTPDFRRGCVCANSHQ